MKRTITIILAVIAVSGLLLWNPVAMAGKPDGSGGTPDVIAKSNGFPSGMHFNLNIHGVLNLYLEDPCLHEAGGNSVFIELYGKSIIEYLSGSKRSGTELEVIDPCASDDGKVSVKLPMNVLLYDDQTAQYTKVPVAGYYVYGRILGTPQNGKEDPEGRSKILFSANTVTDVYNIDDDLQVLGLITWNATYYPGEDAFYRFEDATSTGKGKSRARDLTHLFEFTGWVVDATLDTNDESDTGNPDGIISIWDVPLGNYDVATDTEGTSTPDNRDFNSDGEEDDYDVEDWLDTQGALAVHYENEWIFNIADFVTTEGEVTNDGTKLFQVRFYPYFESAS